MNRRQFMATTATAGTAIAAASDGPKIGILVGTTYTTGTLEARLDETKAHGLQCVQISLTCAGLPEMPDTIPPDLPARIRRETAARGLELAVH